MSRSIKWSKNNVPDLSGRVAVITGANSGTGYEATRILVAKSMHVVMACRNVSKATDAAEKIKRNFPNASLEVINNDLADLSSIKTFAEEFGRKHNKLDVLVNNAGVMQTPHLRTKDRFELQIGVNHFGHFALTGLLFDRLRRAEEGRVVTMSSFVHYSGKMVFDDLNWERRSYNRLGAYAQSNLANLLFAYELQRRISKKECGIKSFGTHPGYARTNLQSSGLQLDKGLGAKIQRGVYRITGIFAQSASRGAEPLVMAATDPHLHGGEYLGPKRLYGTPQVLKSSKDSYDETAANKLWEISEAVTGITYHALL